MNRPSDEAFARRLSRLRLRSGPALVAVSGGVDSLVLLDLLVRTRDRHGLELIVAHADHGIHPESAAVAAAIEAHALRLGLSSVTGRLKLGPGTSETRARTARMRWLDRTRREHGARYILLAHHADDQAETVLMRLLRGSGPAGLAGMPARRGPLVRPLLGCSRKALVKYAEARGLEWWNDPANADPRHLRSWIRATLLPELEGRLPDVRQRLSQASRHAASHRRAWSAVLRRWPGLDYRCEARVHSLSLPVLAGMPASLRFAVLETLARRAGALPGIGRLRRAWRSLEEAQSGATADLGGGWRLERAWDRLRLLPPEPAGAPDRQSIATQRGSMNWGDFRLDWATEPAPPTQPRDGRSAWFIPGTLVVRGWRAGDRVAPLHGAGHRLAVRCFQDARVPSSDRSRWPILEGGGELAWIPAVCRADVLVPRAGEPALRVAVTRHG
ncbi:MAG TPA: tRNA lysidine(34) synthetase TilS [Gemmatimonadales bacterium]|nr:tRNA lysidine(34) synthetase TilS [Gemmatimonadales bacterium]